MKPRKTPSVKEYQVLGRFESLRKILLDEGYQDHLDRPLAYWALPADRRLPLALLGRKLGDLLSTPFSEISATPGIGEKKIRSLIKLLSRAAETDPAALPAGPLDAVADSVALPPATGSTDDGRFDPATVSEVVWAKWRASVVEHGLAQEKLGRLAPSLRNMTRVIWNRRLSDYTDRTLAEIRRMKTHGEKRVRAILEVFHGLHGLVAGMGTADHLVVRIVPRLIDDVETWMGQVLRVPGIPSRQEILQGFVSPLLEQVRVDAVQQISNLAENRLGLAGPITSVRQVARDMGLTRARVYQLLNEINDIMVVRWPTGRQKVYQLRDKFEAETAATDCHAELEPFLAAVELFYPGGRRGADGPFERPLDTGRADDPQLRKQKDRQAQLL